MYKELVDNLMQHADWAAANEWETPITLWDNLVDAAEAISILQSDLEQVKAERDAAVDDLRKYGQCGACKNHYRAEPCGADLYSYCDGGFEWRGVTDICEREERRKLAPCDVCRYNLPGSGDGKPCAMCPATSKEKRSNGCEYCYTDAKINPFVGGYRYCPMCGRKLKGADNG